jgi:probable phosphoglycerate mutase
MVNSEENGSSQESAKAEERKPIVTYILLVRHGENEWVSTGKLAGRTPNVHLNDKGKEQAEALAEFLAIQPIDAIYSSPLERCLETAMPLAQRLGLGVQIEQGVLEVDYGDWHGVELKQAAQRPEWAIVQHFPSIFHFPQGEGLRHTQQRAVDGIERILATHAESVVAVFSHGDVIRTLLAHYAGVPLDLFQRLQISTGSISTIAFYDGRPAIVNMNVLPEPAPIRIKRELPQPATEVTTEATTEATAQTSGV